MSLIILQNRACVRPTSSGLALLVVLMGFCAPLNAADQTDPAGARFFENRIRPVLVQHCYACHSSRAKSLEGELRLDHRSGIRKGGESGPAVVPGDVKKSLLISALRYEEFEMPPKKQLPANVVADFVKWIEMGAPDPRDADASTTPGIDVEAGRSFWAYRPLVKPVVAADMTHGAETSIDALVLARLKTAGLSQGPVADRTVLVRRVYFDLIGLPPTPQEIDEFLQDQSPDAYERLVDRLLSSPRFGERWGRHWLDVARYAESITLRGFLFPEAWRYRDYVIDTFNADRSFANFITEQIAGDLLPANSLQERHRNLVATTFLTMGNNNLEDQDKGKLRMDVVDEQLETIGRGFLAQTIGCARCHDHKFDPIPTRDYYALAGILRNTKTLNHANVSKWIELPLPMEPSRESEFKNREKEIVALQAQIKKLKGNNKSPGSGLGPLPLTELAGVVIDDEQAQVTGTWTRSTSNKSYVGPGYQHDQGAAKGGNTATFRPAEALEGEYEVRFAYTPGSNRSPAVPVTVHSVTGEKTTTINQKKTPPIDGRFHSLGRYQFKPGQPCMVTLSNQGTTAVVIIDAVQFLPAKLADQKPAAKKPVKPMLAAKQLASLEKKLKLLKGKTPARAKYMTVQEEKEIADTKVHLRGNVHTLGETVPRGFLQVLSTGPAAKLPNKESGRRELGAWIAATENPLTSRVLANRLWHWMFGSGLVRTVDNFGITGEKPSHPELLDYLATRLLEEDWSVKMVLREIVLSQTYQLSSQPVASSLAADPGNRLLWRMNPRRLEAENLLDTMLMISGQLRAEIGGPMVRNGTPNDYNYRHEGRRRAIYWPVLRNSLPDIFQVFDFANPSMVTGRRDVSSTSSQGLFMLNNPWVIEQSEQAAIRLLEQSQWDDRQRLEWLMRATLGRPATEKELNLTLTFVESASADESSRRLKWTQVVQALFSSLDFRYNR